MKGRCLFALAVSAVVAGASPERAQPLLRRGLAREALDILRLDLVKHPQNASARYNYAVGAYAAGIYPSAIETLAPLATSSDPLMSARSQFQIGNASFRLAEQMMEKNPAGAAVRFEEAVKRFDFVAQQPGEFQDGARENAGFAHQSASAAFLQVARAKVTEGDRAARVRPEEGFSAWEASLEFFDKAQKHGVAATAIITAEKQRVEGRLAEELFLAGGRTLKQGRTQALVAPERGIELIRQAITFYERSGQHGKIEGTAGVREARQALAESLQKYAVELREKATAELARSGQAALDALGKATASLDEAGKIGADADAIAVERALLAPLWPLAYIKRGDDQVEEAARVEREGKTADQIRALGGAVASYDTALQLRPDDPATASKSHAVKVQLSALYTEIGGQQLAYAQEKAEDKVEEALASVEKSVQSFTHGLRYNPDNPAARDGLAVARKLLEELKERVKKDQRKAVEKSQDEMKDPKDLKDLPKDLELKLLDYRNNQPASKTPQLLTAPENRPRQNW